MVGLLGPNGAGKSTILKLAAGTLRPNAGRVCLLGDEASRLPRREAARRVAVVPQEFTVQFPYTVRQIVEMGRTPRLNLLGTLDADDHAAVDAALATTEIAHLADRVFNELSGGERQRVLLALALAQEGQVLLLDEPTAHLDIRWQIETLELLRRLNAERGLTILAALHDLNLAARYFSRLILLNKRVVADGPPSRALEQELLGAVYGAAVTVGVLGGEEHLSVLPPGHTWKGAPANADVDATGSRSRRWRDGRFAPARAGRRGDALQRRATECRRQRLCAGRAAGGLVHRRATLRADLRGRAGNGA